MSKEIRTSRNLGKAIICLIMSIALCCSIFIMPNVFADPPEPPVVYMDFICNGESFMNIRVGDFDEALPVPDDFNLDEIESFEVKRIKMGDETYTYDPGEYTYDLLDSQGRHIFDARLNKVSDNYATLHLESHKNDIQASDIPVGESLENYFCDFFITNVSFYKDAFRGVEASTDYMPDNYDNGSINAVDLSTTSEENPGDISVYYGQSSFALAGTFDEITNISLVDNGTVPPEAIEIDNVDHVVTVLSNFYNLIPLKVELADGTIGYINVSRIGIFVTALNQDQTFLWHGNAMLTSPNFDYETGARRIAATFYHDDATTYEDYDLIVNITYQDGSTEIVKAIGVGDVHNCSGDITGSDYLLWKEEEGKNRPDTLSITAVKKGATDNATAFGGAEFGSGAGIEWKY